MKTILAFFAVALLATFASAATHYVDIYGHAPFTQVQPAIDAASAGDTIVVGRGVGYQGFTVDRRLVIIGAGTSTIMTEGTRIDGIVAITDTADSTEIQGLWIIASAYSSSIDSNAAVLRIQSGATGIFAQRCFVENTFASTNNNSCVFLGAQSGATFIQSTVKARGYGRGVWTNRSGWALTLISCVFGANDYAIVVNSPASGLIMAEHCVMTGNYDYILYVSNCLGSFLNSAFLHPSTAPNWSYLGSVTLTYCAANGAAPPGTNNIVCSAADFINLTSYTDPRLCDYHLSETSVLRDTGDTTQLDLDGSRSDIGIYGGMHPYVDGGVPDYPFVLDVDVPTSVPQSGAVRVYARGRIGPGY